MVSFKICPICGTRAHRSAAVCATCGASLADVAETTARAARSVQSPDTDRRFGEIDLLEGEVRRRGSVLFIASTAIFILILAALAVPLIASIAASRAPTATPAPVVPTATIPIVLESNTPAPSPVMATVTPPPPPPTSTPTPSPCTRVVQPGDDLISIIFNCGHRSLDVMPLVLDMNNIAAPELIQQGQEIIVPLPTPTPDPNAAAGSAGTDSVGVEVAVANTVEGGTETENTGPTLTPTLLIAPTETLLPGVGYHLVQPNESMVSIAFQYHTNAETLSQLNPEIAFSQCDFGLDTGGERCTVLIVAGQQLRVPVPTPTPSLTPTLTGSETPTPSATPTFNAPSLISPPNRVFFLHNELITLRWVGTGVLADDEAYLVVIEDLTTGNTFRDQTRELFFIVPDSWQGTDPIAHDYRWSIGVIRIAEPDTPRFVTDPRLFTWQGRSETS